MSGNEPKNQKEIESFFTSREIEQLKTSMCDIGSRMWQRGFVDGNGGNLTIRVGNNLVLCTPTLISKGFMKPEDMCLVTMDGDQVAGEKKRTSEVLTHLGIMNRQPNASACCHAHPPTATGFAVAGTPPERFLTPEAEIFLGEIGIADFREPGSPECSDVVGELAPDHTAIFMCNHGVITWGEDIERAYWRMENIETLCINHLVARELTGGEPMPRITGKAAEKLSRIYRGFLKS